MMRAIIILVMLNLMLLAYFQMSATPAPEGHQPLPALSPEDIQILSNQEVAALPAPATQNAGAKK